MPFWRESAPVRWGGPLGSPAVIGDAICRYIISRLPAVAPSLSMDDLPHFEQMVVVYCSWIRSRCWSV